MAQELVLLSEVPLTADLMAEVARQIIPNGKGISYRDGEITQFVDAYANPALTVFNPVPVYLPQEAAAQLWDPPGAFGLWTEVLIPFAASAMALPLAEAFAAAVGGTLRGKR